MGSDKVIVLCEDIMQEKPVRAWLKMLGYNTKREVAFLTDPTKAVDGRRNDNNAFVDSNYARQVKAYRERAHRMQCALIVVRDADEKAIAEYQRAFDQSLTDDSQGKREASECVAIVLPARNIETWLAFLAGHSVNETDDYKKLCRTVDVGAASQRFARLACGAEAHPDDSPDSLKVALESECRRIPKR